MKLMKKAVIGAVLSLSLLMLTGCTELSSLFKDFEEDWKGLTVNISTYDENSQVIDSISGKSMKIERNKKFDTTDGDGSSRKDSSVLDITIGGKTITHVGSSLVAAESGLHNYFNEYAKTVDVVNGDRSIPILNSMMNKFRNEWAPKSRVVLIRSQNGTPLATYSGDSVAVESTDVPKSTSLLIDGKRLFIYRCDFTVYDSSLLG